MPQVALILGVLIASSHSAGAAANLLTNPSFEQVDEATGYPLHWSPAWQKPTACAYTLACARTGAAAAIITDDSDQESHGLRSAHVQIVPDTWYEARVYVRIAECSNAGFALYLEYWNRAGLRTEHRAIGSSETGPWRMLKLKLKAPPGARTATVLIYGSSATIGEAYFDDASLVACE